MIQGSRKMESIASTLARTVFVVTGPTSGLGLAVLQILLGHKVPVLAVGRRIDRLSGTRAELVEADFAAQSATSWLRDVSGALESLLDDHPDKTLILLSNAGTIAPLGPAVSLSERALQEAMRVNFVAPYSLARAAVDIAMKKSRTLRIVNITTGAAVRPLADWLAYCSSKAACKMALDVLAFENPAIELVHVDPGIVDTAMQAHIRAYTEAKHESSRRPELTPPSEAAGIVLTKALVGLS